MDPFNGKSSEFDRRSSLRRSLRLSISGNQNEEEDYDLAEATISDGFRPTQQTHTLPLVEPSPLTTPSPQSTIQSLSTPQESSVVTDSSSKQQENTTDRPLSTVKPPRPHDSLTLRNDGSNASGAPLPFEPLADAPQIRPQSPYRGPSGPSHPYQMYPQRTLSNATSSTALPTTRHSYDGPRGPTHPYALYTQNIVPSVDETPQQQIPVGFPIAGDAYRRQIGPDGEEAGGLIGPLGHTEELPPYTRYPDQPFAPKTSIEASQETSPTNTTASPQQTIAIAGAGGIGVATRNPEFSATEEDLEPTRSRPSTISQHDINTAARDVAEKPPMNKWQRRAKKNSGPWQIQSYNNTNCRYHTFAYGSPGLPPLMTGFFALPPLIPSQAPKDCFNDANQSQTWSCEMPFRFYSMGISREENEEDTKCYDLTLTAVNISNSNYLWGTQPPQVKHALPLTLVNDTFDQGRGPAWWLKVVYDKTVIIGENGLNPNTKRWDLSGSVADFETLRLKKSVGAKDGDKCWICTWPDTTLEIFIYPGQKVKPIRPTSTTSYSQAPTSTDSDSYSYPTDPLPAYPNAVKFVERRIGNPNNKASCRQVEIIDNGQDAKNLTDGNGKPIQVQIIENASSLKEQREQHQRPRHVDGRSWHDAVSARGVYELTQCGCLWWAQ
ncbi:hypothetical protein PT974_11905 [Cladobotryum mycophilum]|uniref:DUF7820 domain-containing protein n=1 Tax=Cladobotryum mycophilum TaxID=491253 RepID=A0ABR0S6I1_9HYPO